MRRLTSIVAVNQVGVIGLGNSLPWRVRTDLQFFKTQTSGNIVIMGRKTHDSLGKCLPNRHNVVISHQLALFQDTPNCVLRYSIFEALLAAEMAPREFSEVFVIGGASIYGQFTELVDRYLITVVDKAVPDGDAFFDQGFLGDEEDWTYKELASGVANNDGDEADFTIVEFMARDPERRLRKRQEGLEKLAEKMKKNIFRPRAAKNPQSFEQEAWSPSLF